MAVGKIFIGANRVTSIKHTREDIFDRLDSSPARVPDSNVFNNLQALDTPNLDFSPRNLIFTKNASPTFNKGVNSGGRLNEFRLDMPNDPTFISYTHPTHGTNDCWMNVVNRADDRLAGTNNGFPRIENPFSVSLQNLPENVGVQITYNVSGEASLASPTGVNNPLDNQGTDGFFQVYYGEGADENDDKLDSPSATGNPFAIGIRYDGEASQTNLGGGLETSLSIFDNVGPEIFYNMKIDSVVINKVFERIAAPVLPQFVVVTGGISDVNSTWTRITENGSAVDNNRTFAGLDLRHEKNYRNGDGYQKSFGSGNRDFMIWKKELKRWEWINDFAGTPTQSTNGTYYKDGASKQDGWWGSVGTWKRVDNDTTVAASTFPGTGFSAAPSSDKVGGDLFEQGNVLVKETSFQKTIKFAVGDTPSYNVLVDVARS